MKADLDGFGYPAVNEDMCIDCRICSSVCPVLNHPAPVPMETAIAMISKDEEARSRSSSGGIMSLLAERILDQNGVVYGAAYDLDFRVVHKRIDSKNGLDQIRRAKYAQSDLSGIFRQVEEDLQRGPVLFVGTPCQCAGLKSFINRKNGIKNRNEMEGVIKQSNSSAAASPDSNLILVDFVCHSIPSPGVWEKYVKWRSGSQIPDEINQRNKETGWSRYAYSSLFNYSDGKKDLVSNGQDVFMKLFIGSYITRSSCADCHFKGKNRSSDLSLGDFWGIWDLDPEMDDNRGTSLVVVHTEKGKKIVEEIKPETRSQEVELDQALKQNPAYFKISTKPEQKEHIMERALNSDFAALQKELIPSQKRRDRIRRICSDLLHSLKVGLSR